ncbi:MAG: twin-arginine translocase TatA/TatE family subunit [Actinomycetota bacterium]|nr:twin-arginine translocase TatA/TatE family subunit [Actinomycetota bacterium]
MPQLGPLEIMAVAVIALVVFGPQRLPEIARTLGRVISEFKRQANDLTSEFKSGLDMNVDDDDDDVPEPASGGLYANEDEDEADPSEPPLTAGADTDPDAELERPIEASGPVTSNGAPVQETRGALEEPEAESGASSRATAGEIGDQSDRERGG